MKILVGIDGSNTSKDALRMAIKYAIAFNGDLIVVTSMISGKTDENEEIRDAERELEWARETSEAADIDCKTHLLIRGNPVGEDIVRFVDENDIELVVVGVKRRSRVGKILMGSNAQFIIMKAGCPVLTVK